MRHHLFRSNGIDLDLPGEMPSLYTAAKIPLHNSGFYLHFASRAGSDALLKFHESRMEVLSTVSPSEIVYLGITVLNSLSAWPDALRWPRSSGYANAKKVDQQGPEKRQEGRGRQSKSHTVVRGVLGVNEANKHD
jgi:hypothetical protein